MPDQAKGRPPSRQQGSCWREEGTMYCSAITLYLPYSSTFIQQHLHTLRSQVDQPSIATTVTPTTRHRDADNPSL